MPILVPKLLSLYRTLSFTIFGLLLLRIFGANINAFHIIPQYYEISTSTHSHQLHSIQSKRRNDRSPIMDGLTRPLTTSFSSQTDDEVVRSPRTPTYAPNSISFLTIPPFDASRALVPLFSTSLVELTPPPPQPLAWVWQCHLCRTRYPLGATRRCLLDGHFYCSGETDRPNQKRKKKQGCSSEFDYIGWKAMEQWKRKARKSGKFAIVCEPQGCENCEFPSQCRYAGRNLPDTGSGSFRMTDVDQSRTSTFIASTPVESLSRFYKDSIVTFESILAGPGAEASKPKQSKVTDYYKPDRKNQEDASNSSTSATSRETIKSTERRSSGRNLLSPIQEKFVNVDKELQVSDDRTE
jgi:hypothetical protein